MHAVPFSAALPALRPLVKFQAALGYRCPCYGARKCRLFSSVLFLLVGVLSRLRADTLQGLHHWWPQEKQSPQQPSSVLENTTYALVPATRVVMALLLHPEKV